MDDPNSLMIEKCSGKKSKESIVSTYDVRLVTRLMMYKGQSIQGCCGPITTEYFIFNAEPKDEPGKSNVETIIVGSHCGREFLSLIGEKLPPVFSAIKNLERVGSPTASNSDRDLAAENGDRPKESRNEDYRLLLTDLNRELYNAIHLLVSSWGGACSGTIAEMLIYLREHPERDSKSWAINAFARIVEKDRRNRSLGVMASELRRKNPSMMYYSFDLLNARLEKTVKKL